MSASASQRPEPLAPILVKFNGDKIKGYGMGFYSSKQDGLLVGTLKSIPWSEVKCWWYQPKGTI